MPAENFGFLALFTKVPVQAKVFLTLISKLSSIFLFLQNLTKLKYNVAATKKSPLFPANGDMSVVLSLKLNFWQFFFISACRCAQVVSPI